MNIDKAFGIHAKALQLRARRAQVLAANLANADTPNYKARDMDFSAALKEAAGMTGKTVTTLRTTHKGHMTGTDQGGGVALYDRKATQPSADGNTVDTQREQAAFAENAVHYQASLSFLSGTIKTLLSAIKGE
ncbi:MAG TPA: flagellar basal body rod protein FlgB [Gammaproteobacteria bacterium]|nr:flagellar basal body rod protein FlgB [Gammaproteobacteria bacterium]